VGLFISDIRFHGSLPASAFLRIWGSTPEEMLAQIDKFKKAESELAKDNPKNYDSTAENHYVSNLSLRNRQISEDIT